MSSRSSEQLEGDFLRITSIADILVSGLSTGF
jgi:hypothetical protein